MRVKLVLRNFFHRQLRAVHGLACALLPALLLFQSPALGDDGPQRRKPKQASARLLDAETPRVLVRLTSQGTIRLSTRHERLRWMLYGPDDTATSTGDLSLDKFAARMLGMVRWHSRREKLSERTGMIELGDRGEASEIVARLHADEDCTLQQVQWVLLTARDWKYARFEIQRPLGDGTHEDTRPIPCWQILMPVCAVEVGYITKPDDGTTVARILPASESGSDESEETRGERAGALGRKAEYLYSINRGQAVRRDTLPALLGKELDAEKKKHGAKARLAIITEGSVRWGIVCDCVDVGMKAGIKRFVIRGGLWPDRRICSLPKLPAILPDPEEKPDLPPTRRPAAITSHFQTIPLAGPDRKRGQG